MDRKAPFPVIGESMEALLSRRGVLSDPATQKAQRDLAQLVQDHLKKQNRIDYAAEIGLPYDDLDFNGPEDGYPFIDWSDLTDPERAHVLTLRIGWVIEQTKRPLDDDLASNLAEDILAITVEEPYDHAAATRKAVMSLQVGWDEMKKREKQGPQPADPKHLMAEGSTLARAKHLAARGHRRKVTFDERVSAFTMLYGDKIAIAGDMLTGVTITDSEEAVYQAPDGSERLTYEAMAVSL